MKLGFIAFLLLATSCWSQNHATAANKFQTTGLCSPVTTGNNNRFTITCEGVPDKLRSQIVELLNRIAKNQVNASEMMNKLNSCVEGVRQVQEQQQPWRLTESDEKELRTRLQGLKAKAEIFVLPSDQNSNLLGTDLLAVLQPIGWISPLEGLHEGFGTGVPPPDLIGVRLVVDRRDASEVSVLQAALRSIGLNATVLADGNLARDGIIFIEVGAKPNP